VSGTLTAQFELTLLDQLSGPIERIEQLVGRLTSSLDRLGQNAAFDSVWEPVPRCVEQTDVLSEALNRATGSADILGEGLGVTATAATEAGSALERTAVGATVLEESLARTRIGTSEAVTGLEAVTAAAERTTRAVEQVPQIGGGRRRASEDEEESGSRPRYGRRVVDAAGHFHESVERGVGQAFGAAAMGFGLIEPIHMSADYQNAATHIGITLKKEGAEDYAFARTWQRYIDEQARLYGQKSEDLMESSSFLSMENYDERKMRAVVPTIAKISTAYNADPDSVGRTGFALQHNLGLTDGELTRGLADLAQVGKISALDMKELAPLFPEVAAHAGGLGMHGLRDVADIGAMLAIARKSVGQAGSATADMTNFMQTLTSTHGIQRIGKILNVDSVHQIVTDVAKGRDPLEHFIDEIAAIKDPEKRLRVVTGLFANQQDQNFARSLSTNILDYHKYRDEIRGTDPAMINADYTTARSNSQLTQLNTFEDSLTQTGRHIGTGFVPTLNVLTEGLHGVLDVWDKLDKAAPGVDTALLTVAAGALVLTGGIAALGAVSGPLVAGFGLVGATLGIVTAGSVAAAASVGIAVVALGVVAYGIYRNWDHIKETFVSFEHWVSGWGDRVSGVISGAFTHIDPKLPASPTIRGPLLVPTSGPGWHGLPSQQPMQLHVTHAPGLAVHAAPHPSVQTTVLPSGGRMMNRP